MLNRADAEIHYEVHGAGFPIDKPHPAHTSAETSDLVPDIEVQKDWRGREFLQQ